MKITVNQLRRIIKEEVGRVMEGESGDQGREEMQRQLDREAINTAIENLTNMLDKVSPVLRPGIETSIKQLKALLTDETDYETDDETDYGTEESEEYSGFIDHDKEVYESRRRTLRKR